MFLFLILFIYLLYIFSLYCKFTYYIFFIFSKNNVTRHLSVEFFPLMWTLHGISKGLFY
ncbi:unnamed protein product [Brassica oleracea var. botrytis]